MKVIFEKTLLPCVLDGVVSWHILHGYVWNVKSPTGEYLGVLYATLLSGDGTVIHFSTIPGKCITPVLQLAAYRKALRIVQPLGVVYATIPAGKEKLVSVVKRLGFSETGGNFHRQGVGEVLLLKLLDDRSAILESTKKEKEVPCQEAKQKQIP